jgi:hypothetical protein
LSVVLARAALAVRLLRGEAAGPGELLLANVVRAHGTAAVGLALAGDADGARHLLQAAAELTGRDGGADGEAWKALAASYHNLASHLHPGPRREATDRLMLDAAALSRQTWAQAGTWINVERADYQLSQCAAALGDGAQAKLHAQSCLALCEANDADAFERFFAHEALAVACVACGDAAGLRQELATLRELLEQVDASDRAYCEGCLAKLTGTSAAPG